MAPRLQIQMTADASGWKSEMQSASGAVREAQNAVVQAKRAIVESMQEQIAAAKVVGASQDELAAITQRAAQMRREVEENTATAIVAAQERVDAARMRSIAIQRAQIQQAMQNNAADKLAFDNRNTSSMDALKADILARYGDGAKTAARSVEEVAEAEGHMIPQTAAASAGLRALEGNFTNNIRAGERFLTLFGPMRNLLMEAFPYIGAAVLGVALFEMGRKAYDAIQNVVMLKSALEALNNLELSVSKKLQADADAQESAVESILQNTQGRAAALRQKYAYQGGKGLDLSDFFYSDQFKGLQDNVKANYETLYKNVAPQDVPARLQKISAEVRTLTHTLADLKDGGAAAGQIVSIGGYGPTAAQDTVKYVTARLKAAQDVQKLLQSAATTRDAQLNAMQVEVPIAEKQDREKGFGLNGGSAKAAELQRKAQEEQRKRWDENHAEWELESERSAADEALYWAMRAGEAQRGSQNYISAIEKESEAIRQMRRETAQKEKENGNILDQMGRDFDKDSATEEERAIQRQAGEARQWISAQQAAAQAQQTMNRAQEDAAVQYAVTTGAMSKQAAVELQNQLAAQRYLEDRARLEEAVAVAQDRSRFTSDLSQKTAAVNAQAELAKLDGERAREVMAEQGELAGQDWREGMRKGLADFVDDADQYGRKAGSLVRNGLDSLNSNVSAAATGSKTDFAGMFRGLGQQASTMGLQSLESSAIKALGFGGKPDGTRANPLYVTMAGLGGGGAAGGLLSKLPGVKEKLGIGSADSGDDGGGGFFADVFDAIDGARAGGGPISPGGTYLVGEHEPELLSIPMAGSVTPLSQVSSGNGGGNPLTVHVDARGATDPAMVETAARRAVFEAAPHIMGATLYKQQDDRSRLPASVAARN